MKSELNNIMPPAAITRPPVITPRTNAKTGDFVETLRTSLEKQTQQGSREERIKAAANQLVSVAFIKPLMAQVRQSPFKNEMFSGGQGAEIFQDHLDTLLADRMTQRTSYSIADAVYRKFAGPVSPQQK